MEKCFLNLVPPYFSFLSILEKKELSEISQYIMYLWNLIFLKIINYSDTFRIVSLSFYLYLQNSAELSSR